MTRRGSHFDAPDLQQGRESRRTWRQKVSTVGLSGPGRQVSDVVLNDISGYHAISRREVLIGLQSHLSPEMVTCSSNHGDKRRILLVLKKISISFIQKK